MKKIFKASCALIANKIMLYPQNELQKTADINKLTANTIKTATEEIPA